MLVLKGLVGFHRPFNFSFFSVTGWGIDLDYCVIEWFALETNRDHSVVFEIASKYCISDSFVGHGKKIRDTKGTFHAKIGSIKDRNGMDLTEAEDIKKRWQEYTEELYKKDFHDPDNHDGVITDLEPDIRDVKSSGP